MIDFECKGHNFVGRIFDLAMPVHLGAYEYDQLVKIAPDRAYVFDVEKALSQLVERVNALSFVQKLLAIEEFPIETTAGYILRTEWLWGALELMTVRFVSISDTALILANVLFEFGLDARKATEHRILPRIADPESKAALEGLLGACKEVRDERNRIVHRGERRRLGTSQDNAILFKSAAFMEAIGSSAKGCRRDGTVFDARQEHVAVADRIEKELDNAGVKLLSGIATLFDTLAPHFEKRWREKLNRSQLGLS